MDMQGMRILAATAFAALALGASPTLAAEAKRSTFGKLPDGRQVPAVTLTNGRGVSATVIAYGASLQSLIMPDGNGRKAVRATFASMSRSRMSL
jgi:aldose 1-epimerase